MDWRSRTLSASVLEAGHYREAVAATNSWASTVLEGLVFRVSELIP